MKNLESFTPCSLARNALILEFMDSAAAFVERLSKKFIISSECSLKVAAIVLNDLKPESATRLYHRARLSLSLSAVEFLLENIALRCATANKWKTRLG